MSLAETLLPDSSAVDPLGTTSLNARVDAILSLTQQITKLVSRETALLKTRRAAALRETEAEKTRLSNLYAREMRAIEARPELLAGITPKQKEALRQASETFRSCIVTHVRAIARIRAVSEGLVVAIGEELNRRLKPVTSYKGPDKAGYNRAGAGAHSPAFGFDRSI